MKKFNVLFWEFNGDQLEHYDVLPYFRNCYKNTKKKDRPTTLEDLKKFIEKESRYRYWAKCEYEIILHAWPPRKNEHKLDIHQQVMMNIDIITEILWEELKRKNMK